MSKQIDQHVERVKGLGVRMTEQRLVILNELSKVSEPESAYLLKDKLDKQGYTFNISTIYRVLEFWMEHNVVHKLTSNNTFMICTDHHADHVHLLQRCSDCGDVKEQCSTSLGFEFPKIRGFSPDKAQVIELVGHCAQCKR